jgi:hypothetical protein
VCGTDSETVCLTVCGPDSEPLCLTVCGPHCEFCLPPVLGVQSLAINLRNLNGGGLCKEQLTVKTRPHPQELKNVDLFRRSYGLYMTKIDWNVWASRIKPPAVPTDPSTKPWYNLTYDCIGFESPSARNRRPQWRGCSYDYGVLLTQRERERERERAVWVRKALSFVEGRTERSCKYNRSSN